MFKYNKLSIRCMLISAAISCGCLVTPVIVQAADAKGEVPITYSVDESTAFPLTVSVSGDGYVSNGEIKVQDGKQGFLIPVDETKTFTVVPNNGAQVKRILLNDKDELKVAENNTVKIDGKQQAQTLLVEFSAKDTTEQKNSATTAGVTNSTPQKNNAPQTGDYFSQKPYFILTGISAVLFILTFSKKYVDKHKRR